MYLITIKDRQRTNSDRTKTKGHQRKNQY